MHWQLGRNARSLEAALEARGRGRRGPAVSYELGARALADRDFPAAAQAFGRARAEGSERRESIYFQLYALAMAGRPDAVRALAGETGVSDGKISEDADVWRFLDDTFVLTADVRE